MHKQLLEKRYEMIRIKKKNIFQKNYHFQMRV